MGYLSTNISKQMWPFFLPKEVNWSLAKSLLEFNGSLATPVLISYMKKVTVEIELRNGDSQYDFFCKNQMLCTLEFSLAKAIGYCIWL